MIERGKGLGEWIRVEGEGAVEFLDFGFDNFKDCRDVEVIVCLLVGDIPGSVEEGAKDFGLETIYALDFGCLG